MSKKWFLYLRLVLVLLFSVAVTSLFKPSVAVPASLNQPSNVSPTNEAEGIGLTPIGLGQAQ